MAIHNHKIFQSFKHDNTHQSKMIKYEIWYCILVKHAGTTMAM